MNVGTTYFVAPVNHANENADPCKDRVILDLSSIVHKFQEKEARITKHMSVEMQAMRKQSIPVGIKKVERLLERLE